MTVLNIMYDSESVIIITHKMSSDHERGLDNNLYTIINEYCMSIKKVLPEAIAAPLNTSTRLCLRRVTEAN